MFSFSNKNVLSIYIKEFLVTLIPIGLGGLVLFLLDRRDFDWGMLYSLVALLIIFSIVYPAIQINKVKKMALDLSRKDLSENQVYDEEFERNTEWLFNKIQLGILKQAKWQLIQCEKEQWVLKYVRHAWSQIILIEMEELSNGNTLVKAMSIPNNAVTAFRENGPHSENIKMLREILHRETDMTDHLE
ncbi:MAG: hypothetical protein DWQ02_03660 [Bacteroidetes bacterium]|nr:MAG: hypothetical protein DWQ02_03660 [Bacteroidota bacterium]